MAYRWRIIKGSRGEIATGLWDVAESFQAMHDRPPQADAARVLGLPDEHVVAMVITFGYPESEESRHRGIARTPLADLVHYERW